MQNQVVSSAKKQITFTRKFLSMLISSVIFIFLMCFQFHYDITVFLKPYLSAGDFSVVNHLTNIHINNNERDIFIVMVNAIAVFCLVGFFKNKNMKWIIPLFVLVAPIYFYSFNLLLKTPGPIIAFFIIYYWIKKNKKNLLAKQNG